MRVAIQNRESLIVTGLPAEMPRGLLRDLAEDIAGHIEERIAEDFERERGAGKALGSVSDAHEQRKARDGLDLRRGHMYGDLQDALNVGGNTRITLARGTIRIVFDEDSLRATVEHAEYYAESKVQGGRLLVPLPKDAAWAEHYLRGRIAEWESIQRAKIVREGRRAGRPLSIRRGGLGSGVEVA